MLSSERSRLQERRSTLKSRHMASLSGELKVRPFSESGLPSIQRLTLKARSTVSGRLSL